MAEVRPLEAVQGRWRSSARVAVIVSVLAYSWWVTTFRPFTVPIRVGTAVPAVFLILLAIRDRHRRIPLRTWVASWHLVEGGQEPAPLWRRVVWRRGTVAWTVLIVGISVWELVARFHSPRSVYPTISSLMDSITRIHGMRFLAFVLWLLFGRDLLRR
jgi:hypothetical protein